MTQWMDTVIAHQDGWAHSVSSVSESPCVYPNADFAKRGTNMVTFIVNNFYSVVFN